MTFYELEKRCKQRRLKRLLYIILGVVFVVVIFFVVILFNDKKEVKTIKQQTSDEINLSMEDENIFEIKKENIKDNKNIEIDKKEKPKKIEKIIKQEQNHIDNKKPLLTPIIPVLEKPKQKIENKVQVIKTVKPQTSIVEVDTLPSYRECIRLARKYLREKKYDLALKWAKNANIQNKSLPDSWIITAKALFYSGKKEKAIDILRIYLKFQKNKRVEDLLKKFENEEDN